MNCKLIDIEMPLNKVCPASHKKFVCYKQCGFSPLRDNSIIPEKKKTILQTKLFN